MSVSKGKKDKTKKLTVEAQEGTKFDLKFDLKRLKA
jgi:hypothetical protein